MKHVLVLLCQALKNLSQVPLQAPLEDPIEYLSKSPSKSSLNRNLNTLEIPCLNVILSFILSVILSVILNVIVLWIEVEGGDRTNLRFRSKRLNGLYFHGPEIDPEWTWT